MRLDRPEDVGAALRRGRKQRGLTQAQVADVIGVSRDWVNRVERGNAPRAEIRLIMRFVDAVGLALTVGPAPAHPDLSTVGSRRPDLMP